MKQAANRKTTTTTTSPTNNYSTVSKFQQFKQEKLKLNKNNLNESSSSSSSLVTNPKAFETLLKQARISGSLNLSNYHFTQLPLKVLRINIDKFEEEDEKHENKNDDSGFKWWQQIDLQKLIIASNKLKEIPKEIEFLDTLITFDVNKYSCFKCFLKSSSFYYSGS